MEPELNPFYRAIHMAMRKVYVFPPLKLLPCAKDRWRFMSEISCPLGLSSDDTDGRGAEASSTASGQ